MPNNSQKQLTNILITILWLKSQFGREISQVHWTWGLPVSCKLFQTLLPWTSLVQRSLFLVAWPEDWGPRMLQQSSQSWFTQWASLTRAWMSVLTALRPTNSQTKPFCLRPFPTATWPRSVGRREPSLLRWVAPRNEHLGADGKDQVEEVFTAEHDVENLRSVIRERLHLASRNEQVTFLQAMCRQSFGTVATSADQLIEVQVFKARLHLIYLEEHIKLAPTGSQFQTISN